MRNENRSKFFLFFFIFLPFSLFYINSIDSKNIIKIGYIDIEYILKNSKLKNTILKEYNYKRKEIIENKSKHEELLFLLKRELRRKEKLLGYSEYLEELKNIKDKIKDFEKKILKLKIELKNWEEESSVVFFDEFFIVLEIISKEESMPIILSRKKNILYADDKLDMTQKAINLLNKLNERKSPSAK